MLAELQTRVRAKNVPDALLKATRKLRIKDEDKQRRMIARSARKERAVETLPTAPSWQL